MSAEDKEMLCGLTVSGGVVDVFSHFESAFVLSSSPVQGSENTSASTIFAYHFVKLFKSY